MRLRLAVVPPKCERFRYQRNVYLPLKFANHITLGFNRFRWDSNGD